MGARQFPVVAEIVWLATVSRIWFHPGDSVVPYEE